MKIVQKESKMLIAKGDTKSAINILLDTVTSDSELYRDLILLSHRYRELEQHFNLGTIHMEVVNVERSKIANSLLRIINQLENNDFEKNINARVTFKKEKKINFLEWVKNFFNKIFG